LQKLLLHEFSLEVATLRHDVDSMRTLVSQLTQQNTLLTSEKNDLTQDLQAMKLKLQTSQDNEKQIQDLLDQQKQANKELQDQWDKAQIKLNEEQRTHAQFIFFNRSLKTQVCELEETKEELSTELNKIKLELDRFRSKYPKDDLSESKNKK
jgi:DNA repair exonuclease SbcCD ATPase subunit